MKRRIHTLRGAITIYLCLTLLLTGALICTLIESARVNALNARLRCVTYMAQDSVFSQFAQPIFDEYGVMFYWNRDDRYLAQYSDFADRNLSSDGIEQYIYTDIYQADFETAVLSDSAAPTDKGGQPFADQVNEYMEYYLANDIASRLLENVSIFDQGDKVDDFFDKIEGYKNVFSKVENAVSDVKDKIDDVKNIAKEPSVILDQAEDAIGEFKGGGGGHAFSSAMDKLRSSQKELEKGLEKVQSASDDYYKSAQDAKAAVDELENELSINESDFDSDVYDCVKEQIEDIKQKSSDTDYDYYLIGSNEITTSDYMAKLQSLDSLFEQTKDPVSAENVDRYSSLISEYQDVFSTFDLESLGINYENTAVEKEDDGFLSEIKNMVSDGFLGLVADDISDKSTALDTLPSVECGVTEGEDIALLEAAKDKAVFGEYVLTHFNNYTDSEISSHKDGVLSYEAEYIIVGKASDKENLGSIAARIASVRTGCNLISILKSAEKKAETFALATSLVGCTGMPVVVKVFQILIIAVWALAEGIADVKALLAGHKIHTIKNDDEWYLSLSGIKNFGEDCINVSGHESGLSYESYLRLLLLMQNKNLQYFRTMDIIQANACSTGSENFRISSCLVSASVQSSYSAPQLFVTFPFVNHILNAENGRYRFEVTQNYSYCN